MPLRFLFLLPILGSCITARAEDIPVHNLVYLDETGQAYSIDPTGGVLHKRPITFTLLQSVIDGLNQQVPTATSNSGHTVTLGSFVMLEPDGTPSDLISWVMMPNRRDALQFFSDDGDTDAAGFDWADVGILKSLPNGSPACTEHDLSGTRMLLTFQDQILDPKVNLSGDIGCVYVATTGKPGADTASGENPIGYVFVSDVASSPEPSSILPVTCGLLWISSRLARRRRCGHRPVGW